jgi:hypothetical protein
MKKNLFAVLALFAVDAGADWTFEIYNHTENTPKAVLSMHMEGHELLKEINLAVGKNEITLSDEELAPFKKQVEAFQKYDKDHRAAMERNLHEGRGVTHPTGVPYVHAPSISLDLTEERGTPHWGNIITKMQDETKVFVRFAFPRYVIDSAGPLRNMVAGSHPDKWYTEIEKK